MVSVRKLLICFIVLIVSFSLGRLSYRSQVTEYLEQDYVDSQDQLSQLKSCQVELKESEVSNELERLSFNALWSCVQEYSLLFDLTKFDQKYSIDEVQRIRECL